MAFLKTSTLKGSGRSPFKQIDAVRDYIVSGDAYDPLDNDSPETYTIPAGTPMAPLSTGKLMPWRAATCAGADNSKTQAVASTESFRAGDLVSIWTALSGTADHRTIESVTAPTTIVLTAVATVTAGDTMEVRGNGAHDGTTAALTFLTMPTDFCLLQNDVCVYHASDGSTFDTPAVGVVRGQIRTGLVNGPGTAFNDTLRLVLPGIEFDSVTPGS
jgi:hypothetical protein